MSVERASHQKHLGINLHKKLNFKIHVETVSCKVNKGISIIKKLRHALPRRSLVAVYKACLRPHIDYGDVIYDQLSNESFCEKLESILYKAPLAITGATQGTYEKKFYGVRFRITKIEKMVQTIMLHVQNNEKSSTIIPE